MPKKAEVFFKGKLIVVVPDNLTLKEFNAFIAQKYLESEEAINKTQVRAHFEGDYWCAVKEN